MNQNKKIVLIGPPNAGKSTIKKVFFEKENPISLLNKPLLPSRGIGSNIYSIFKSKLGVFDLAGQENHFWFSNKANEIFRESNIIICIFDITNHLESIISFLVNIYKIKKELNLYNCQISAFLHKIDLVNTSYVNQKFKIVKDFITYQHPKGRDFKIYTTSITKDFFFDTYYIFTKILNSLCQKNLIQISINELEKLKTEILILLKNEVFVKYHKNKLIHQFDLSSNEAENHLKRLQKLGFIKTYENFNYFLLNERAKILKSSINKELNKINYVGIKEGVELFHTFLDLTKMNV